MFCNRGDDGQFCRCGSKIACPDTVFLISGHVECKMPQVNKMYTLNCDTLGQPIQSNLFSEDLYRATCILGSHHLAFTELDRVQTYCVRCKCILVDCSITASTNGGLPPSSYISRVASYLFLGGNQTTERRRPTMQPTPLCTVTDGPYTTKSISRYRDLQRTTAVELMSFLSLSLLG